MEPMGASANNQGRHYVLLAQLAKAPEGKMSLSEANRKLPVSLKKVLHLGANQAGEARQELADLGYMNKTGSGKRLTYEITEAGRDYLQSLPPYQPPRKPRSAPSRPEGPNATKPRGKIHEAADESMRQQRFSYLMLQLLRAHHYTLSQGQARITDSLGKDLHLNAATAWHVRHELAEKGYAEIHLSGRTERYTLTQAGRLYLGTLDHADFKERYRYQLSGKVLNDLLEASREAAKTFESTPVEKRTPATHESHHH